jgi:hypothetical protein
VAYTTEQGQWLLESGEWMLIDRPGVSSGR